MKRVLTAVVLIPVVLSLLLRAPFPLFAGVVGLIAVLGAREFLELSSHYGTAPLPWITELSVVLLFAATIARGSDSAFVSYETVIYAVFGFAVAAPFLYLMFGMRRAELAQAYPAAAASLFAILYAAVPLLLFAQVRRQSRGVFLCLTLLLIVWTGDTAAYYFGRMFGRHKLAPRISPGKTWEGTVASLVGSVGVALLILNHATQISTWLWKNGLVERAQSYVDKNPPALEIIILAIAINVTAQIGDLLESLLKRGANVKDSGTLLPGHGGILDRIDALLFAAPVLWYYAALRVIS